MALNMCLTFAPQTTLMSVNMPCVEPVGPGCLSSTASVPPLSEESRTLASGLLKIHVCFLSYSGYSPVTSIMKWMTDLGRRANLVTKTRSRHLQNIPGSSLSKNVSCSALAAFFVFLFFLAFVICCLFVFVVSFAFGAGLCFCVLGFSVFVAFVAFIICSVCFALGGCEICTISSNPLAVLATKTSYSMF